MLSPISEIITEAKAGKMFILVDDEGRENEGDLVIPAAMCDDQKINFMAKHGRGLICLALTEERVRELTLPLMSLHNQSRHQTAFTVSIEAREGISTGISAFDRAKTIRDAIDPTKGREALVSPGHIFPLKAEKGGVLVRAGHTEAAVDIARLAGLNPSGVICEIMNDDGSMARMPDLKKFAKRHQLKIATIADLIEYRRQNEKLIEVKERRNFVSKQAGEFELVIYQSSVDLVEHVVLVKGKINEAAPVMVRMHHLNIFSDCLDDAQNPRSGSLARAMKKISRHGSGVIVLLRQPNLAVPAMTTSELRNYGTGAQILADLGIKNMLLLTNSKKSVIGLDGYGIRICGYRKI
ncbi:MAG: 3,4-dihydroxy-2-butanone-4-phosphate synthase [Alphaproteobacteria bacterium]|nr:3,4-dihydroxy-2-butanone-4-phosphate synthase [Alphaproteobacteria bacterium]